MSVALIALSCLAAGAALLPVALRWPRVPAGKVATAVSILLLGVLWGGESMGLDPDVPAGWFEPSLARAWGSLCLGGLAVLGMLAGRRDAATEFTGAQSASALIAAAGVLGLASAGDAVRWSLAWEVVGLGVVGLWTTPAAHRPLLRPLAAWQLLTSLFLWTGWACCLFAAGSLDWSASPPEIVLRDVAPIPATVGTLLITMAVVGKVGAVPGHLFSVDLAWRSNWLTAGAVPFFALLAAGITFERLARFFGLFPLPEEWPSCWLVLAAGSWGGGLLLAGSQDSPRRWAASLQVAGLGWVLWAGLLLLLHARGGEGDMTAAQGLPPADVHLYGEVAWQAVAWGGLFALVLAWAGPHERGDYRDEWAGLAGRRPWLTAGLGVALATLVGLPGTPTFWNRVSLLLTAQSLLKRTSREEEIWAARPLLLMGCVLGAAALAGGWLVWWQWFRLTVLTPSLRSTRPASRRLPFYLGGALVLTSLAGGMIPEVWQRPIAPVPTSPTPSTTPGAEKSVQGRAADSIKSAERVRGVVGPR